MRFKFFLKFPLSIFILFFFVESSHAYNGEFGIYDNTNNCPINSSVQYGRCVCNVGYYATVSGCIPDNNSNVNNSQNLQNNCPLNSIYKNGKCECIEGYIVGLTGCEQKNVQTENNQNFQAQENNIAKPIITDTSYTFKNSAQDVYYEYPRNNRFIKSKIEEIYSNFLNNFNFTEATTDEYTYNSSLEVKYGANITSYVNTVNVYTGGAHGGKTKIPININKNGTVITARDLLSEEKLQEVSEIAYLEIKKQLEKKGNTIDKDLNDWILKGTSPLSENYQKVWIDKDSLVVFFEEYQVAYYAAGSFEVKIPLTIVNKIGATEEKKTEVPNFIESNAPKTTSNNENTPATASLYIFGLIALLSYFVFKKTKKTDDADYTFKADSDNKHKDEKTTNDREFEEFLKKKKQKKEEEWRKDKENKEKNNNTYSNNNFKSEHSRNENKNNNSESEWKQKYLHLIKMFHPDKGNTPEEIKFRTNMTAKINRAWQDKDYNKLKEFMDLGNKINKYNTHIKNILIKILLPIFSVANYNVVLVVYPHILKPTLL